MGQIQYARASGHICFSWFHPYHAEYILGNITFAIISQHWDGTVHWQLALCKITICIYCIINPMDADALTLWCKEPGHQQQWASSSSLRILLQLHFQHQRSLSSWANLTAELVYNSSDCLHWGYIVPVPVKYPWRIWVKVTTPTHSKT